MESTPISIKIAEQIADRKDTGPVALDVPLYDVINVDALEALTDGTGNRPQQANLRVEFTYYGYAVTVGENGKINIDKQPPEAETDKSSRSELTDE